MIVFMSKQFILEPMPYLFILSVSNNFSIRLYHNINELEKDISET